MLAAIVAEPILPPASLSDGGLFVYPLGGCTVNSTKESSMTIKLDPDPDELEDEEEEENTWLLPSSWRRIPWWLKLKIIVIVTWYSWTRWLWRR